MMDALPLALAFVLSAQLDAGVDAGVDAVEERAPELRMVAVPTIAWVAEHGLIVVHHRKGVCATSHTEACNPGGFDKDVHTLRAVSLAAGKERWRNGTHPLLHGELRDVAHGDRVVALITSDVFAVRFALLDPATGQARSTCNVDTEAASYGRFQSRHGDASGAFFIQRRVDKDGGAPPPDLPSLLVRATAEGCTVVEGAATPPLSWPNEDERVRYGGTGAKGFIDVTIDGKTRRVTIDEQPRCRRYACRPIP
jgi:hypothetical protein